jgi:3-hydroxyisobutyrate dehydrogenase-like beta-hydroxyacid dehydrogenase
MAAKDLGFIGLGNMGAPMAGRLVDAGYNLTVFDTRAAALQPFTARGATAAASPAAVASAVDTVLVSLPTPAIVRAVALGENGVASGTRVKTFVDLSTTGPRAAQEIAAELAARNIVAVDSPVSGGVSGAQKGTLAVMVSGPKDRHDALKPALEVIGKVFYLGEKPGLGQMMKLANNLLSATAMAISCEAIVMGVKAGLDPKVMVDVINAGSGRNSATQEKFPRSILPRTFDYGFATGLMYKDVKLCLEEAQALGVPMWVASAVQQLWLLANNELGPDSDFTRIIQCLEGWAGVEVKGT